MSRLKLNKTQIDDANVQKTLELIEDFINQQTFIKGQFSHVEITIPQAVTNYKYPHRLGFLPLDVILTRVSGVTPTFNYALFDGDFLDITTTGASTFRAFIGRYSET